MGVLVAPRVAKSPSPIVAKNKEESELFFAGIADREGTFENQVVL